MNRLTELYKLNSKHEYFVSKNDNIYDSLQKLGQLEDIEETLGIDLPLLFKVVKADKIYNKFSNEIQEWNNFKIDLKNNKVWYAFNPGLGYGASRKLSDYGVTWALSRGELE